MIIYRIEHKKHKSGMWYSKHGEHHDYFKTRIPMEYDPSFHARGKTWYAGTESLDSLRDWFSLEFMQELLANGYHILMFEADEYIIQPTQVLFTKEKARLIKILNLGEIYDLHLYPQR